MEPVTVESAKQSIPALEKACRERPTVQSFADLGVMYFTVGEPEAALILLEKAWEKSRDNAGIGLNVAMTLKDLGRHEDSARVAELIYHLDPEDSYKRLAYAEALLKAGLWKQAWPLYDNARPTQQAAAADLGIPFSVREWDGGTLSEGHQLLVINEGGTGDRLSYPRWLPELTRRGINWKFYPYAELFSFFRRVFPHWRLVKDGDDITPTHWTTAFALPAKLGAGPNEVPEPLPIDADPMLAKAYAIRRTDNLPVVGICYSAAEKFQGGRKVRSLSEGQVARLVCATADKVHWVNLQHGERMPYPVSNLPFSSWEDTAALVYNLDAVVTVDTGVMHLAGAMRKPTAVLLSGNSCWKFLKSGAKCVWYPTVTLYRNEQGEAEPSGLWQGKARQGMEFAIDRLIPDIRSGAFLGPANDRTPAMVPQL